MKKTARRRILAYVVRNEAKDDWSFSAAFEMPYEVIEDDCFPGGIAAVADDSIRGNCVPRALDWHPVSVAPDFIFGPMSISLIAAGDDTPRDREAIEPILEVLRHVGELTGVARPHP